MKKMWNAAGLCRVAATLGMAMITTGCGPSAPPPPPPTQDVLKVQGKEELKKRLTSIGESGSGGSGLAGLSEAIDALKGTDAALADGLMKDLQQLQSATTPDQIKAIAKRMAAKL